MVSVKEIRFFQLILLIVLVLFDVVAVHRPVTEVQNSLVTSAQCEPDSQLSTTPVNSIIESSTSDWTTIEDDLIATSKYLW